MRSAERRKVNVLEMKCLRSLVGVSRIKQFDTILFPQDMIQDIYKLHWNIIHKSTGVT